MAHGMDVATLLESASSELFPPAHGTHLQRNGSPEHSYVGI